MKNILLPIFILLSLASFGQAPIPLDTVNNACHIDKIGFAKDNMTYTLNGDSSINIFIVGAASYQNTHYSRFRDPAGSPFANRTALTNWIDLYFFANALADSSSTGGGASWGEITGTIGDQTDLSTALDAKLTTPTPLIPGVVIGTTLSTSDIGMVGYSQTPLGDQLVMYDFGGQVKVSDPVDSNDATSKKYVDANLLSLGETSTTAYRGDRGKTAYDHSQIVDGTNPHATTFANIVSLPTTIAGYGITDAIISGGNTTAGALVIGTNNNNAINFKINNVVTGGFNANNYFYGSGIHNATAIANAQIQTGTAGTVITRNVTGGNVALIINQAHASSTGDILQMQAVGSAVASVSRAGLITGSQFKVSALNAAPASATDTGTAGEIRITAGFIYVCTATNVWVRAALATW